MSRGQAYHCFCSDEQLEMDRYAGAAQTGSRRSTSAAAATSRARTRARGSRTARPAVDPLPRVPTATARSRSTTWCAARVAFSTDVIGDPVLVRSDGVPAYNFAVVIDDALMEISACDSRRGSHLEHAAAAAVLRGVRLDAAAVRATCRWCWARITSKLSKRHGATSVARISRARLSAGGARELPRADRLVARARDEELLPLDELAQAVSASRMSGRAPACSTRRSWPG